MATRRKRNNRHSAFSLFGVVRRHTLLALFIVTSIAMTWLIFGTSSNFEIFHGAEQEIVYQRGPHKGILVEKDGFAIELTIFEDGVQPVFRVYPYFQEHSVDPSAVNLHMELAPTDEILDKFDFVAQDDFLQANRFVREFHTAAIVITALYQGKTYHWSLSASHRE